jgi:peroxiredoxin
MKALAAKVQFLANVAVIVTALILGVVLTKNYILPGRAPVNSAPSRKNISLNLGRKISLPAVDWVKNNRTLVFALSQGCHFCSESANFYKRIHELRFQGVRLLAVLPQDSITSQKYLNELGVTVDEVKQASLDSIGVEGTPTLLLVDKDGVVQNAWVGKLPDSEESEVLAKLK